MAGSSVREQAIKTLAEKLHGFDVAMFTTVEPDGSVRSRPMVNKQPEFEGDLWFLARGHSRVVWSIQRYPRVNLTYCDPGTDRFVSVTGTAHILRDAKKAEELWDPSYESWLNSPDDPELCIVKVSVENAQSWSGASGAIQRIEGFVPSA